jgi:hypothetical protein
VAKDKSGRVCQAKDERHQDNTAHFRFERRGQSRLDESAKEELFHQADLQQEPDEAKRQAQKQLIDGKVCLPKRSAATAEKILETKQSSAHNKDDRQMITAEGPQILTLNPEIASSITKAESKDRERNGNEDDKLLCQGDEKLDPR